MVPASAHPKANGSDTRFGSVRGNLSEKILHIVTLVMKLRVARDSERESADTGMIGRPLWGFLLWRIRRERVTRRRVASRRRLGRGALNGKAAVVCENWSSASQDAATECIKQAL
jgi:hypothetical protein